MRGDPAGAVRLDQELRPLAASQAQERRRAEKIVVRLRALEFARGALSSTAGGAAGPGPETSDAAPDGGRAGSRARAGAAARRRGTPRRRAGRERDRPRVRLVGLHEHAAGRVPAAAAGELRHELERPLLGAEVRQAHGRVGVHDGGERDAA